MSMPIRNEGPRISSAQTEISSTSETVSKGKTSEAQESSQTHQTANEMKQAKASQSLATATRLDGQLQAISQQIRLKELSSGGTQQAPSAYTGGGSTTQLPKADSKAVSQSYAAKGENKSQTTSSAPRETMSDETLAANQAIIDAARTFGRREGHTWQFGNSTFSDFTEFVPARNAWDVDIGDMKVFLRSGTERTQGDETKRITKYFDPDNPIQKLGTVFSTIKDGIETITDVVSEVPGAITLKKGDTRKVPDPKSSEAGTTPSTWDPQPNGTYGSAGVPNNTTSSGSSSNSSGSTGNTDAKAERPSINDSERPVHGASNGSSSSGGTSASGGSTPSGSSASGGSTPTASTPSGGSSGGTGGTSGTGSTSGGNTVHRQGSEGPWEPGPSSWSEYPPTQVTVEEPETEEGLEEEAEVNHNDDDSHAAWGDYADTSIVDPQFGDGKRSTAPIDYGNANDPNAPSDAKDFPNIAGHVGPDPSVTDPGQGEGGPESTTLDGIRLDMAGTLRDGGNPLDPAASEAPGRTKPNPGDTEHIA